MENEKTLLNRISSGDESAFRVVYDLYRGKVYTYALRIIKSESKAEDILQDVFLKIWKNDNLYDIDNFEAYLKTITRNHTLKILRRQQLEARTSIEMAVKWNEFHNETEESLLLNETATILNRGIDQLPPKQKLVYNLCREQGLKYDAAAKLLSISPLTVKTHMQLSLRFLRNYLQKHTDVTILMLFIQLALE